MSEFIKRMQARIKEAKTVASTRQNDPAQKISPSAGNKQTTKLTTNLSNLFKSRSDSQSNHSSHPTANSAFISPMGVSRFLTYLLMLACAVSVTYWLMRVAQVPSAPGQSALGMNKGMTLYSNQDASAAYDLFGNKPLVTENIYLQGIVVTSRNKDGSLDGFAIFEIDGKPTNAISVGEGLGKGLTLHSIGDESATLLYQGQKLDFKLNKVGPAKGNQGAKGANKK